MTNHFLISIQGVFTTTLIEAFINTVDDLYKFIRICYGKYGLSLKFLREFVLTYFPEFLNSFISILVNRIKNTVKSWINSFLSLFK